MALDPSTGKKGFPLINLAQSMRVPMSERLKRFVDQVCSDELKQAGIKVTKLEIFRKGEVQTAVLGSLNGWVFERYWRYWVAKGPGIPPDKAQAFHEAAGLKHGVRVEGHCMAPTPLEECCGFAVGMYHIDTQEGLNVFARLLREIYIPRDKKENASVVPSGTVNSTAEEEARLS